MTHFPKEFLLGESTAAHQVEGNNTNSDCWAMEHMEHTSYVEPSLDAVDHYNRYEEDIKLMAEAGLNAYRFSLEWAPNAPRMHRRIYFLRLTQCFSRCSFQYNRWSMVFQMIP